MDGLAGRSGSDTPLTPRLRQRRGVIAVVEDGTNLSDAIFDICDFLEVTVRHVPSDADLALVLADCQPMAVIASVQADGQDGCHVMKTVAGHDRHLPILVLTGGDPILAGAADAVEEVWGLSCVAKRPVLPGPGELVEFFCLAGQMGRCVGLMPINQRSATLASLSADAG